MAPLYGDLYKVWAGRTGASDATTLMTRTTLKYLAAASGADDWTTLAAVSQQQAMVLLDGALAATTLGSQSCSNYRNYLRRFYRAVEDTGITLDGADGGRLWAPSPKHGTLPRRAQVAYEQFVRWAIGRGIWPITVRPQNLLDWALDEKARPNQHWRKEYRWLEQAWTVLAAEDSIRELAFPPLPPLLSKSYALPVAEWPAHLKTEWQQMCAAAAAPLRKGGMRPWRPITQQSYERRLERFLGWGVLEQGGADLAGETWASLLTADRCQDYLNWLVARSGKDYLNPSHTGFLRFVRGLHRFLLGSAPGVVGAFTELGSRCEVQERDKAIRMAPFPAVEAGLRALMALVGKAMKANRPFGRDSEIARMQVDVLVWGLLVCRAPRRRNIIELRIGRNLVRVEGGFELRFAPAEMKGHRKFETTVPAELVPVIDDYLRRGYRALTGRAPADGDVLLVTRKGAPFTGAAFAACVRRLSRRLVGKELHPHLFRHIVATHAAQVWKLTPTELAAFLAHRSVQTVMKYYEVTSPALAAGRFDSMRKQNAAS